VNENSWRDQRGVKAFARLYASGIWKYDDNQSGEKTHFANDEKSKEP